MHTLMSRGRSAARRLAVTVLSVILPVSDDRPVLQAAGVVSANQVRTVTFGLDGTTYEIDLSPGDAIALRGDLATWVSHARRTSGSTATSRTRRTETATTPGSSHATMVRRWARSNGHTVSDRGRLPTAVRQAYDAAH